MLGEATAVWGPVVRAAEPTLSRLQELGSDCVSLYVTPSLVCLLALLTTWICGSKGSCLFNFPGIAKLFSRKAAPAYAPSMGRKVLPVTSSAVQTFPLPG